MKNKKQEEAEHVKSQTTVDEREGAVHGGRADGSGHGDSRSGYIRFLTGEVNGTVHQ
jgi:hypothetical protein